MSFVDWVTALTLLLVAIAGLYAGVQAVLRRQVTLQGLVVQGMSAWLLAVVYLLGGFVSGVAFVLMLRER